MTLTAVYFSGANSQIVVNGVVVARVPGQGDTIRSVMVWEYFLLLSLHPCLNHKELLQLLSPGLLSSFPVALS